MARYIRDKETGDKKPVEIKRRKASTAKEAKPSKAKPKAGGK